MARYQVVVVRTGTVPSCEKLTVCAPDAHAAYAGLGAHYRGDGVLLVSLSRRGPLAAFRRDRLTLPGGTCGSGGSGGTAGVREPRRPKPTPPSLRVALDEP